MAADGIPMAELTPARIRALREEHSDLRPRDLAARHGLAEAALVAAQVGHGATRIAAHPDRLMPLVSALGDVMALTRNESCVIERRGTYGDYHSGAHAQMVLGEEIDLRLFAGHWLHAFAVGAGEKSSVQVFDAAGDAVHKIHLKPESDRAAFDRLVAALRLDDQSDGIAPDPRAPVEAARADPVRAETLREDWARLTDTHQFLRLVSRLKMNRLGAYRIVGAPWARPLATDAVARLLHGAAGAAIPVMVFVGNRGCIEIHGGPIETVAPMGPWINVLDPRFNLHLRGDHVAEVWLVDKPTRHGAALSVEAFDAQGALILQIFGSRRHGGIAEFNALLETLHALEAAR